MEYSKSVNDYYENLLNMCSFVTNRRREYEINYDSHEILKVYLKLLQSNIEIDNITIGDILLTSCGKNIITKGQDFTKDIRDLAVEIRNDPHIKIVHIIGSNNIDLSTILEFPSIVIENKNLEEFSIVNYPIDLKLMKFI